MIIVLAAVGKTALCAGALGFGFLGIWLSMEHRKY
jgi:hypothetical protein